MADHTNIEWADATWNPIVGCSIVSHGCTHCYAMRLAAARLDGNVNTPAYLDTTHEVNGHSVWTGKVARNSDAAFTQPLRWKKPRRIFVNSMGDVFHESVPDAWIEDVFTVMAQAPQHTYLVLTKRAARMRDWIREQLGRRMFWEGLHAFSNLTFDAPAWPLPNVWLGVSCEDQARTDERVPQLLETPAAVRFVSAEPLLGPIDFTTIKVAGDPRFTDALRGERFFHRPSGSVKGGRNMVTDPTLHGQPKLPHPRLDWIIAGGESGKGARPMHPNWPRNIRDQCAGAGVSFFFKQWGDWGGVDCVDSGLPPDRLTIVQEFGGGDIAREVLMGRIGKAAAGRTLDGATHNAFPAEP